MKTRVLSDLHLGHGSSRIESIDQLEPLFEGVDHFLFAGDIWQERARSESRGKARGLFDELQRSLDGRGIAYEFLRGNHDPGTGEAVAWRERKRILITHGDALYPDATPWSREMPRRRKEVAEIIARYAPRADRAEACADRAREIALSVRPQPMMKIPPPLNFFATALWPPSRPFEIFRVWRELGQRGIQFLEESGEGAQVLICGHFHAAQVWSGRGRHFINTGSFMKGSTPWLVDLEKGLVEVREVALSAGGFHAGERRALYLLED